jgi:hypothetical protein
MSIRVKSSIFMQNNQKGKTPTFYFVLLKQLQLIKNCSNDKVKC